MLTLEGQGWLDPHKAKSVPLEVLLDGMERLCKEGKARFRIVMSGLVVFHNPDKYKVDKETIFCCKGYESISELRTAIIAAIEKLLEGKGE